MRRTPEPSSASAWNPGTPNATPHPAARSDPTRRCPPSPAFLTRMARIRSDPDIVACLIERDHFLIGGRHSAPRGQGALDVVSPSTEEPIGRVPLATSADLDAAVDAARAAFDDGPWPRHDLEERAQILLAAYDALLPLADRIS